MYVLVDVSALVGKNLAPSVLFLFLEVMCSAR